MAPGSLGTSQKGRYISYNIGSATATVYDYEETTDKNGNTVKTPATTEYNASTKSSDPNVFGNIEENILV